MLVIVILGSIWATQASAGLFGLDSLDGLSSISAALEFTEERTSQDSAQFVAARINSPLDFPYAVVTVLFRPFPWEASGLTPLLSAFEGMALALLVFRAIPGCLLNLGGILQRGQLLFGVTFCTVFVYLFSAIGNFGILSRQRAQVVPFVLLLVAFGIATKGRDDRENVR